MNNKNILRALLAAMLFALALSAVQADTTPSNRSLNETTKHNLPPGTGYISVSAGTYHTCGIKTDGTVGCWGESADGKTTAPSGTFTQINAGRSHTCGVKTDGTVDCWGLNADGQATDPSGNFTQVGAGENHTCGVKTDGTVDCWGSNAFGQATEPAGTFSQVSAGVRHTCGLKTDGTVDCWGEDYWGQSADPSGTFTQVAAGGFHSCGVKTDGTVDCWGRNNDGQAADPSGTFTQIDGSNWHNCGVKTDGTVDCWGNNTYGQSNDPSGTFTRVEVGEYDTCGVRTDGTVDCWGRSWYGEAPAVAVNPATLPNGAEDTEYAQTLTGSGGTAPYSFKVTAGNLPTGLTLDSNGSLSGTPTVINTFNFTVQVTDTKFFSDQRAYALTIGQAPTSTPTNTPTNTPTVTPTYTPTNTPTVTPTYTPTNPPGALNLALASNGGSIAGVSSTLGGFWDPSSLIDGQLLQGWSTNEGDTTNQYVIVRLANGGTYTINRVRLDPAGDVGYESDAVKDFEIRVSTAFNPATFDPNTFDPSSFTTVLSDTAPQTNALYDYTFPQISAKYVMLFAVNNHGGPYLEARELEVYSGGPVTIPSNTPTATATRTETPTITNTPGGPSPTVTHTPTTTSTPTATVTRVIPSATPTATVTNGCVAKPEKPTLLKPKQNKVLTSSRVKLDWSDAACAVSYKVQVKNTGTGQTVFKTTITNPLVSGSKTGVLPAGTYKWFVKACNPFGCARSAKFTFTK